MEKPALFTGWQFKPWFQIQPAVRLVQLCRSDEGRQIFIIIRKQIYIAAQQLSVNGQLERQTNVSFPQDYGVLPLFFGSSGQTYWDHKFRGLLDEVSLYNRALSSNEIAAVYAIGAVGKCKAVTITAAPQSQTVIAGTNTQLTVTATGLAPRGISASRQS